jgi:hypothetical protein
MGNQSKSGVDIERIFKPNAIENIDEALSKIVSEEE